MFIIIILTVRKIIIRLLILCVQVFANIKLKPKLTDAAVHIFDEIRLARENCQPEEKKIVYESIQQNAFMAHPERVILAMLG